MYNYKKKALQILKKEVYILMEIDMGKRNRGIALAETLILTALGAVILSFIFIRYRNINEQKDIQRAVNILETVVQKYASKSMASKKSYSIYFDYSAKTVTVKDMKNEEVFEIKNLPEKLSYATPYDRQTQRKIDFHTTINGNLSKSFSVYIFGYSDTAKYRVAFYNFQQSRILRINIYKNKSAGDIHYSKITDYHYKQEENELREGWKKE